MFDSVPSNLPFEPSTQNAKPATRNVEPSSDVASYKLQDTSKKEPEDIFAGIKEPVVMPQSGKPALPQVPTARPKSGSKVFILVLIPLVVVGLGVGGWFVYQSFTQGSNVTPPQQQALQPSIPSSSEPDNADQTLQNPMPEPDDSQLAASQASIGILKAQQEQAMAQVTSSEAGFLPTVVSSGTDQVVNIPVINPPPMVSSSPTTGQDDDEDGLTNAEESLLGIDSKLIDSDGDGFEDLSEVKNGYDPLSKGGKLVDSRNIKTENVGSLSILVPTVWTKKIGPSNSIIIETGTPATFSISTEPFSSSQTLTTWLLDKYSGSVLEDYLADKAKNGDVLVFSKDNMTAWLLSGNTVYTFRYSTNGQPKDFGILFDVMTRQAK